MPYDIRAACCEHILRTSDSLVKDLTGKYPDIDYGQPYCTAYESQIPSEFREAQEAYDNDHSDTSKHTTNPCRHGLLDHNALHRCVNLPPRALLLPQIRRLHYHGVKDQRALRLT